MQHKLMNYIGAEIAFGMCLQNLSKKSLRTEKKFARYVQVCGRGQGEVQHITYNQNPIILL